MWRVVPPAERGGGNHRVNEREMANGPMYIFDKSVGKYINFCAAPVICVAHTMS